MLQKPSQSINQPIRFLQGTKIESIFAKTKLNFVAYKNPSQFLQASYKNQVGF